MKELSWGEKKQVLDTWKLEQDARQLLTASNEGMPVEMKGLLGLIYLSLVRSFGQGRNG